MSLADKITLLLHLSLLIDAITAYLGKFIIYMTILSNE